MKRHELINGYRMLKDFTTAGGGQSKWTFAERGGETYFIKQFLSPVYPTPNAPGSTKIKAQKRKLCDVFERHHRRLIDVLKGKCADGGNLIIATDFFRSGSKYYKVTKKVDVSSMSVADISRLSINIKVIILRTVAHSLRILHQANIVHADLKPSNVLIKRTLKGHYAAKLIDFDSSFFSEEPPTQENLVGDLVYYSPEVGAYLMEDPTIDAKQLKLNADIFSMGLLYHEFLTGRLPKFNTEEYAYPYISVNDGHELAIDERGMTPKLRDLVARMLNKVPEERPGIQEVFSVLKESDIESGYVYPPFETEKKKTRGRPRTKTARPIRTGAPKKEEEGASFDGTLKGSLVRKSSPGGRRRKRRDSKLRGRLVDEDEE